VIFVGAGFFWLVFLYGLSMTDGQLGVDGGALAASEVAAAQLGPQLLNVVLQGDHRGLLPS
jgi:hypothetical protein